MCSVEYLTTEIELVLPTFFQILDRSQNCLAFEISVTVPQLTFLIHPLYLKGRVAGQTRRRIFTLDGSNDADSRKDVPFGGFVDIAPHFWGEIPQNPPIFEA